jgi:hypothetical protein
MSEEEIKNRIVELKSTLKGDIFQDGEIMQAIYDLKKQLQPEIEENPELDLDDEACLHCSG